MAVDLVDRHAAPCHVTKSSTYGPIIRAESPQPKNGACNK